MLRAAKLETAKLNEMGRAARGLAEARADWSRNFPRLLDAYQLAIHLERDKGGRQ